MVIKALPNHQLDVEAFEGCRLALWARGGGGDLGSGRGHQIWRWSHLFIVSARRSHLLWRRWPASSKVGLWLQWLVPHSSPLSCSGGGVVGGWLFRVHRAGWGGLSCWVLWVEWPGGLFLSFSLCLVSIYLLFPHLIAAVCWLIWCRLATRHKCLGVQAVVWRLALLP